MLQPFLEDMLKALAILAGVSLFLNVTSRRIMPAIVLIGGLFLSQNADARGHRHHHRHRQHHHVEKVKHVPIPHVRPVIPGPVDPDPVLDPSGTPVVETVMAFKYTFKDTIKYMEPWANALGMSPFDLIAYAAGQQAWTTDPLEVVLYNLDRRAKYVEAQRQIALAYYLSNPPQKKVRGWKEPVGVIFLFLGMFVVVGTMWYAAHTWGKSG